MNFLCCLNVFLSFKVRCSMSALGGKKNLIFMSKTWLYFVLMFFFFFSENFPVVSPIYVCVCTHTCLLRITLGDLVTFIESLLCSELCTKESTLSRVGLSSLLRAADRPIGSHGTMKIRKGMVKMLYCRDTFQLFLSDI